MQNVVTETSPSLYLLRDVPDLDNMVP